MKAPEIPPIKLTEGNLRKFSQQNNLQPAIFEKPQSGKTNSDIVTPSSLNHIHYNKLEAKKAQFHGAAQQIRNVKETLASVSTHLVKMRDALESVVKIYPPYPPGSSERVEALRQFAAIRNMIDQLAVPSKIEGAGSVNLDSAMAEDHLSIDHYQVHAGKGGLDIPHLDANSSNQQICDAIEMVAAAQETLGRRQREFVSYANGFISKIS